MIHTITGEQDLLAIHAHNVTRYPFLLESVVHGTPQARYDILFAFPGEQWVLSPADIPTKNFLTCLDARWLEHHIPEDQASPLPFRGGWFLYLGYELAAQIEPRLILPVAQDPLPVACAVRIPAAIIVDHQLQLTYLMAEPDQESLLAVMQADIRRAAPLESGSVIAAELDEDIAEKYLMDVERIKRYIRNGDVFQVNLSRGWQGILESATPAHVIYQRLRRTNPGGFAALARIGNQAIISSSPERLLQHCRGVIQTRPIAGTRRRDSIDLLDQHLQQELLAHPKERAEHIMLIDLERNDLGRVCLLGTVQVDELMSLESYAHVHHIVSNVSGRLRPGITPGEMIRAVFPGGTITGCPKVRCMEIIAELEGVGRGAYTGSLGYLNHNGDLDLNILIRTLVQEDRHIRFRTGAGIVADSIPQQELEETRAKARGLLQVFARSPSNLPEALV